MVSNYFCKNCKRRKQDLADNLIQVMCLPGCGEEMVLEKSDTQTQNLIIIKLSKDSLSSYEKEVFFDGKR